MAEKTLRCANSGTQVQRSKYSSVLLLRRICGIE